MKKYKYMFFEITFNVECGYEARDKLNFYGESGWKAVQFETIKSGIRIRMEKEEE